MTTQVCRRRLLLGGACALVFAGGAGAQPPQPRIGWLMLGDPARRTTAAHQETSSRYDAFRQGLRDLGHVESQNLAIEYRSAQRDPARLPALAAELVGLNVALLVALEPPAVEAIRRTTNTVPIVSRSSADPVELGWVRSLARPGGNLTGVTTYSAALYGKRLELLKETVPALARVAVLWDPEAPAVADGNRRTEAAAAQIGLKLHSVPLARSTTIEKALESAVAAGAQAALVLRGPTLVTEHPRVVALAAKHKLPAIYEDRELSEAGGLMSYGTNLEESYRRAATYVDKILRGAKPGDLPIEQPTKFELVVNLRAAKGLGLTMPRSLLLRADRVLE